MSLALIFPGQGSQHVGMARLLADSEPLARRTLEEADDVLGFPLSRLMAEGPEPELTETRNAQPALLTHSVAVLRVVTDRIGPVAFAAGHSLGEYSAHVAAGTMDFADALRVVRRRGELMYESGKLRPGSMAAVLGLSDEQAEAVCAEVRSGVCVCANFNSSGQVVLSGDLAGLEEGTQRAREAGAKKVVMLNVSGAFHSPLMESAAQGLERELATVVFRDPVYPVVANATTEATYTGETSRALLVRQLTAPVRWSGSIAAMVSRGVDRFLELGPGSVLCGLNRRNAKGLPCASLGEPLDLKGLGSSIA